MEKVKNLLTKLNLEKNQIDELLNEESELDIDTIADSIKDNYKEVFKNDPDVISPLEKAIVGKERGSLDSKIKRTLKNLGVSQEAISEADSIDSKLELFDLIMKDAKKSGSKNDEYDKLQADYIEANNRIKELEDEVLPKVKQEADSRVSDYIKNTKLREKISSFDLIVTSKAAESLVKTDWADKYNLDLDDDKLVLKTKDGKDPLNEDKTSVLTLDSVLEKTFSDNKLLKLNKSNSSNSTDTQIQSEPVQAKKGYLGVNKLQELQDRIKSNA